MFKNLLIFSFFALSLSAQATFNRGDIVETAQKNGNFSTLLTLVKQAGLEEALRETKKITLFAPTDAAFSKLPQATLDFLANDQEALKNVLLYHVSPSRLKSGDVVKAREIKTLAGKTVFVDVVAGAVFLNKETAITTVDVRASNGIIHVIDSVLTFDEDTPDNDIVTEDFVDLSRYLGTWYEIARYDNNFQQDCLGTRATYGKKGPYITVLNECQKADGSMTKGRALARVSNKETNAELKVSFVPVLNLFGLFAGDYNILALGPDYEYVLVGSKSRDTFWILSRSRTMETELLEDLKDLAVDKGYRRELIKNRPTWK